MQRSEIFNRQFSAPHDKFIFPIFKQFQALKTVVIKGWQDDVISHNIDLRYFVDIKDCRLDVVETNKGERIPVISLKPFVGVHTQEQIDFYMDFFTAYIELRGRLIDLIHDGIMINKVAEAGTILGSMMGSVSYDTWLQENKTTIHILVSLISVITAAAAKGTLTRDHLLQMRDSEDETAVENMIRSLDVDLVLSEKYQEGGRFFENPDSDMVGAYWRYVRKIFDDRNN